MRAYRMKKQDGSICIRIVKGNEVVKDGDFVMVKLNGPIGGEDILPAQEGLEGDGFVPFTLDDGTLISTLAEMQKAYVSMYEAGAKEVPITEERKPRGKPKKVEDDEDDE